MHITDIAYLFGIKKLSDVKEKHEIENMKDAKIVYFINL